MNDVVVRLINDWQYNVAGILRRRLEALKDDLASEDERIRNHAAKQADEILDWLYLPAPLSADERMEKVHAARTEAEVRRALSSTGRAKGRPRTETAQHAIRALSLHYATPLSWRKIALKVKGCDHRRPNPERGCVSCGEAIRNAAGRLGKFLTSIGPELNYHRGAELDGESRSQVRRRVANDEIAPSDPCR